MRLFFVYVHGFQESNGVRIYMLIGAVIGAAAANFFYRLSVFLGVFAGSFFFFFLLIQNTTVSLILGVICGMIGVIIDKYCIIVTTGLSGGKLAAMGIWMIEISEGNYGNVGLIGWLIGIGGIIFQIWLETRCPAEEGDPGISGIDIWGIILIPCFLIAAAGKWIYNHIKNMQDVSRQKNRYEDNSSYVNGSFSLPSKQDFCVHCGAKMSDTARFCSKCGTARRL